MKRKQVTDKDGNRYKGEMSGGLRHGYGTLIYAETQDVYQGDFENDVPHGAGKYIRSGGDKNGTFEGLWFNGKVDQVKKGRAKVVEENGDVYDGGFHHWKRHGQGVLRKKDGEVYEGQFKDGLPNGHGILRYRNGATYDGFFKDGEPDNGSYRKHSKEQSSLYDAKLNSYRGELKHDKRGSKHGEPSQSDTKGEIPRMISFVSEQNDDIESRNEREGTEPERRKVADKSMHGNSRSSSRKGDEKEDPFEIKRRQLDNMRDHKNLRKYVIATQHTSDKKGKGKKKKSKGIFSMFKNRSSSRSRSRRGSSKVSADDDDDYETEVIRDDDVRHYEVLGSEQGRRKKNEKSISETTKGSSRYEEAQIDSNIPQSRQRSRSSSRPRVRRDTDDYEPSSNSGKKIQVHRNRSSSRPRQQKRDELDKSRPPSHHKARDRSRSRSRPTSKSSSRANSDTDENPQTSQRSRKDKGKPRTKPYDDTDWNPSPKQSKTNNSLPPTAPKRSSSHSRRRETSSSYTSRTKSTKGKENEEKLPPPKAPQRGRSDSSRNRRYSSDGRPRSLSRSAREGFSTEGSRRSSNSGRSSTRSRSQSTSSRRSGQSATLKMLKERDDDDFFVSN